MQNDSDNGNNGNKGKWSERLIKMIRDRFRIRKKILIEDEDNNLLVNFGRNIYKVFLALPSIIYTHIYNVNYKENVVNKIRRNSFKKKKISNSNNVDLVNSSVEKVIVYQEEKKDKIDEIKNIDISCLKRNSIGVYKIKKVINNLELELRKEKLQKEIVDLIKKKLVKNINELEMLQSELYVLNELDLGDTYLDECKQDVKEIKKLLSKVKSLKEKYDYLKDNVDFQYMLQYDDNLLIEKILELKGICSNDDITKTINDYKLLEEYKYLYLKIDKLEEDTIKLEEYKNKKVEELKERNIDFDKLKKDIYDFDKVNEKYNCFVKKQDLFLKELEEKVSYIDAQEKVTYRLKGFNQLLGNSFKYLGLLLAIPLKGLVPGIATQTLITKNVVHNLYKNLEWEENRKMVYDAIDYSYSINAAINSLEDTCRLVDFTLEEIIALKSMYMKKFSKYESSFSEYHDAIKKINKIENSILGTKIKLDSIQIRMKEKEKMNTSKLKMVKKLNSAK